ncbi:hypothetical protein ACAG24_015260 [Mycobacterium sp. pW049]|uniref:hypothetical protein n=1 Tax=[Mycobacterium] bulgaricum TaxID=3238985 RepID=UPI00351BC279
MTMFEADDLRADPRRGTGVRTSREVLRSYDLTVIAADVDGTVAAAGGWLCDRVRAGWQVTVLVPPGSDVRALTILGVHTEPTESATDALEHPAAAIAVDARVLRRDDELRRAVLGVVDAGHIEVTVWGESALFGSDGRFDAVRHRLSTAARAFKAGAMRAPGGSVAWPPTEEFVSTALWYPPDGADLVPVAGR